MYISTCIYIYIHMYKYIGISYIGIICTYDFNMILGFGKR